MEYSHKRQELTKYFRQIGTVLWGNDNEPKQNGNTNKIKLYDSMEGHNNNNNKLKQTQQI